MTDFSVPINWGWNGPYLAAATQILNSVGALTLVYAFRYGKAIVVSPLTNAGAPLITAVLSILLLGTAPTATKLAGVALALVAAVFLAIEPEPAPAAAVHAAQDPQGVRSIMIIRRDTSNRRERIVALLREQGSVQIPTLAERFRVSTQTLRKDLNFLDDKGICTRSSGGAILQARRAPSPTEEAIDVKRTLFAEEKARIGRAAAKLIKDDESVLLDSGTTALQVARHIEPAASLVVVTNDVGHHE